jgi:hypothetical protein
MLRNYQLAYVPLGYGSCRCRTGHPFAVSVPRAVTEEHRRLLSFAQSATCGTWRLAVDRAKRYFVAKEDPNKAVAFGLQPAWLDWSGPFPSLFRKDGSCLDSRANYYDPGAAMGPTRDETKFMNSRP